MSIHRFDLSQRCQEHNPCEKRGKTVSQTILLQERNVSSTVAYGKMDAVPVGRLRCLGDVKLGGSSVR